MVNSLSSTQMIWVRFPLSAAYLVKLVNTTDLKSVPFMVIGSSPIVSKQKKLLCMTTRTSIFRMKASRKFGVCFWPWRRLNPKQAKIVAKINKKLTNQVRNQDMKRKNLNFLIRFELKSFSHYYMENSILLIL